MPTIPIKAPQLFISSLPAINPSRQITSAMDEQTKPFNAAASGIWTVLRKAIRPFIRAWQTTNSCRRTTTATAKQTRPFIGTERGISSGVQTPVSIISNSV